MAERDRPNGKSVHSFGDAPVEDSAPFLPVVSRRLYQQVAERIKRHIHSGAMAAGDRLPAEKDLAV
ncbi:MAG TPA: GntR family transcriptional regulator, partial [Bryobacteraceae bacterium]